LGNQRLDHLLSKETSPSPKAMGEMVKPARKDGKHMTEPPQNISLPYRSVIGERSRVLKTRLPLFAIIASKPDLLTFAL